MKRDMTNAKCPECRRGQFKATHYFDELDHKLHCDFCDYEIDRWKELLPVVVRTMQ